MTPESYEDLKAAIDACMSDSSDTDIVDNSYLGFMRTTSRSEDSSDTIDHIVEDSDTDSSFFLL